MKTTKMTTIESRIRGRKAFLKRDSFEVLSPTMNFTNNDNNCIKTSQDCNNNNFQTVMDQLLTLVGEMDTFWAISRGQTRMSS
jgi:hypothetical protein